MRKSGALYALLAALGASAAVLAFNGGCDGTETRPPASAPGAPFEIPKLDAGGAAARDDRAGGPIHFGRIPVRVGEKWQTRMTAGSSWTDPATGLEQSAYTSHFAVEVLAVQGPHVLVGTGVGPAASRVKIAFATNTMATQVAGAGWSNEPNPVENHSYIVDVATPNVVDAATKAPPSAEESERVLDILPDLGTRTQIDQVLPDRGMSIGEHCDALAAAILRIIHPRFWLLERGSATLDGVNDEYATFGVAIVANGTKTEWQIDLKGQVRIRLSDSRLTLMELRGTFVRRNAEHGEIEIERIVTDAGEP